MGVLPSAQDVLQGLLDWQELMGRSLMLAGFYPWQWLFAWERAVGAAQRECLDQWICRFGGGVPLDA